MILTNIVYKFDQISEGFGNNGNYINKQKRPDTWLPRVTASF